MDFNFDVTMLLETIEDIDWRIIVRTWTLIANGTLSATEAAYYVVIAHQANAVLKVVDIEPAKLDEVFVAVAKNMG